MEVPNIFKRTPLIHKIVEEIKDRIIRGELREGEKLSSQDQLAKSLGVSRGSLREALNQLQLMGIIEMKQGSGTYIRSVTPSSFMQSLSPALIMDKASPRELLDARLWIEGAVASLAAKKATQENIRELGRILDDMKKNYEEKNIDKFIGNDLEFHVMIAKSSKNRVLMKVLETIREILYEFIAGFFSVRPETVKTALKFHTRIFKAIECHNDQEAKKNMESHILSLIRMMNKSNPDLVSQQVSGKPFDR